MIFLRQRNVHRQLDARHHGLAVVIDEMEREFVRAFLGVGEGDTQRDGAERMHRRQFLRVDGVERAEQVELAAAVGGGVAEDGNLDVHGL